MFKIKLFKDDLTISQNAANLNCDSPGTISDGTKLTCLMFDLIIPYFFLLVLSVSGGAILSVILKSLRNMGTIDLFKPLLPNWAPKPCTPGIISILSWSFSNVIHWALDQFSDLAIGLSFFQLINKIVASNKSIIFLIS